jgi:hypothetical protein
MGSQIAKTSTLALAVTSMLILLAVPAMAKGPESATLSGPGIDEPIVLLEQGSGISVIGTGSAESDLIALTGLWQFDPTRELISPPRDLGTGLNLSWVNMGPPHLPKSERTIRQILYLYAEGGPIINTPEQASLDGWGGVTGWYRADTRLLSVVERLAGIDFSAADRPDPSMQLFLVAVATLAVTATVTFRNSPSPRPVTLLKETT